MQTNTWFDANQYLVCCKSMLGSEQINAWFGANQCLVRSKPMLGFEDSSATLLSLSGWCDMIDSLYWCESSAGHWTESGWKSPANRQKGAKTCAERIKFTVRSIWLLLYWRGHLKSTVTFSAVHDRAVPLHDIPRGWA